MQGLAFARGLRVVPVSALDALASEAARAQPVRDSLVAAWMDAQRGEVFAALYDATGEQTLAGPSSGAPAATLEAWREIVAGHRVIMTGDGAVRYREVIGTTLGNQARIAEPVPPLAAAVGRIALRHPDRAVLPHAIVPIYVRRPDAELARDREANPTRE
jgi:tRNA threonylcarbamoyl adenosine modification protein YeaZ